MTTKKNILLLASSLLLGYASPSDALALGTIRAKEPKAAVTSTVSSLALKQQFDDACQQYDQLKTELQRQAFDVIVLKERLDKTAKILDIYKQAADYPSATQDGAWADENYKDATAAYQRGLKELDDVKSKLTVAEIGLEKVLVQYNLSMGK